MAQCVAARPDGSQCEDEATATRTRLCAQHFANMAGRETVINAKTGRALGVRPIPEELPEPLVGGDARRAVLEALEAVGFLTELTQLGQEHEPPAFRWAAAAAADASYEQAITVLAKRWNLPQPWFLERCHDRVWRQHHPDQYRIPGERVPEPVGAFTWALAFHPPGATKLERRPRRGETRSAGYGLIWPNTRFEGFRDHFIAELELWWDIQVGPVQRASPDFRERTPNEERLIHDSRAFVARAKVRQMANRPTRDLMEATAEMMDDLFPNNGYAHMSGGAVRKSLTHITGLFGARKSD
jgi:hypothetical protein